MIGKLIENPHWDDPEGSTIPEDVRTTIEALFVDLAKPSVRACGMDLAECMTADYLDLEQGTRVEFVLPQPCHSRVIHENEQEYHHIIFRMVLGSLATFNKLHCLRMEGYELERQSKIIGAKIWDKALQDVCSEKVANGQLTEAVSICVKLIKNDRSTEEFRLIYRMNDAVKITTAPSFENFPPQRFTM